MFLRPPLFLLFTLLLSLISFSASAQEDVIIVKHNTWNADPAEVGRLYPTGNNQYVGTLTDGHIWTLEYKGSTYRAEGWEDYWNKSPLGQTFTFKKDATGSLQTQPQGTKYKLRATLSADKNSISVEFLTPDPPKPVTAIIDSKKITLVEDAGTASATFEYTTPLNASKKSVTVGALSFDGKTYGVASQPSFSDSDNSQTQTLKLVSGNASGFTLSVKGYYMLSVRTVSGIPSELIIRKLSAAEVPQTTLSPTFPESMISCSNPKTYTPDEPLTLWTNEESYGKTVVDVGNYGVYNSVFLLGNGHLGIAIEGHQTEGILINEKTNYDSNPDPDYKYVSTGTYCPIGALKISQNGESPNGGSFLRQLDLTTAVASAMNRWPSGDKTKIYAREYLVSRANDVGVLHFTTDGGAKLSYSFETDLSGSGSDGLVSVTSGNTSNCQIRFNLTFKVLQSGGQISTSGGKVTVTDADEITVVFGVGTNYDIDSSTFYSGESDDQLAARVRSTVESAAALGWQTLYDNHIAEYSPLFNSARFNLTDATNNQPTKTLKEHYDEGLYTDSGVDSDDQSRMVDMLLFAMGRYLNLASSRGDLALPSNLQGIWANTDPAWSCDFHANINLQMNYWATENTNISAAHMPFLNYLRKMAATQWKGYADKLVPGTGGWTHHFATNTFGASDQYNGNYTEAAAWNCTHIWQHYLYTQDRQFLADFFDTLYGAAKFYFGYLKDTDNDGLLEIPNNYSPEIGSGTTVAVHAQQLVYQHLCNTRDAALILGKTEEAAKCQSYINRMYNGIELVNGEQCEWKGAITSAANHRHLSHLMCLYPLAQVSPYDSDPTNFNGSYKALLTRGDTDEGENAAWNTAWKMCCYARSLQGDLALRQLAYGMKERITPDLRTTCKHTFQIEGGAGISAAIGEMLMQSYSEVIDILPALPSSWPSGSVTGLKAVGNFTVDIAWEEGEITEVKISDGLHNAIREGGVKIRFHASTLPAGTKTLYFDGQPRMSRASALVYEPETDSYIATIPAGTPNGASVTFSSSATTGIDIPEISDPADADAPVILYDLQGRQVNGEPQPGIYIRRQGKSVSKILISGR